MARDGKKSSRHKLSHLLRPRAEKERAIVTEAEVQHTGDPYERPVSPRTVPIRDNLVEDQRNCGQTAHPDCYGSTQRLPDGVAHEDDRHTAAFGASQDVRTSRQTVDTAAAPTIFEDDRDVLSGRRIQKLPLIVISDEGAASSGVQEGSSGVSTSTNVTSSETQTQGIATQVDGSTAMHTKSAITSEQPITQSARPSPDVMHRNTSKGSAWRRVTAGFIRALEACKPRSSNPDNEGGRSNSGPATSSSVQPLFTQARSPEQHRENMERKFKYVTGPNAGTAVMAHPGHAKLTVESGKGNRGSNGKRKSNRAPRRPTSIRHDDQAANESSARQTANTINSAIRSLRDNPVRRTPIGAYPQIPERVSGGYATPFHTPEPSVDSGNDTDSTGRENGVDRSSDL